MKEKKKKPLGFHALVLVLGSWSRILASWTLPFGAKLFAPNPHDLLNFSNRRALFAPAPSSSVSSQASLRTFPAIRWNFFNTRSHAPRARHYVPQNTNGTLRFPGRVERYCSPLSCANFRIRILLVPAKNTRKRGRIYFRMRLVIDQRIESWLAVTRIMDLDSEYGILKFRCDSYIREG